MFVKCVKCGKVFKKKLSQFLLSTTGNHYCSWLCFTGSYAKSGVCLYCNMEFRQKSKDQKFCSRTCSNHSRKGIRYKTGAENDKYKRRKNWIVLLIERDGNQCVRCGYRKNPKILNVHHRTARKDGGTDAIENLELLCPNCHAEEHYG